MLRVARWLLSSSALCILGLLAGLAPSGVYSALPGGNIKGVSGDAAQEAVRERREEIFTIRVPFNGRECEPLRLTAFFLLFSFACVAAREP